MRKRVIRSIEETRGERTSEGKGGEEGERGGERKG